MYVNGEQHMAVSCMKTASDMLNRFYATWKDKQPDFITYFQKEWGSKIGKPSFPLLCLPHANLHLCRNMLLFELTYCFMPRHVGA